ncbi:MAG: MBL fold metallo-hydrolase [Lachnospiraceae bacterium]|nr:MBL fold metallo-hydrolase [Lachnospiraceae bacterium]
MKLTMLGTGNAMVTECYNTCFVLSEGNRHFMVDAGGGNTVLHQLKHAGLDWKDMREIFVTHRHVDHLMGVIWMMRIICQNMNQGKYQGEANIYGHAEVIELLRDIAGKLLQEKQVRMIDDRLHLITVEDGETRKIMDRTVTFFDIHSTKAKQFGFSMELDHGEKLTCCGDEPYNKLEEKYARNSKWLLHEAFCLFSQADLFSPYEKHHSTVKDACRLAGELHVENLILYHTEDKNIADRKRLYLEEGQAVYKGNLYVPDDLEVLSILE